MKQPILLPSFGDCDTGICHTASDELHIIAGGIDRATIKVDECDRDKRQSGVRVYSLGTHVATLGAVTWVDGYTSERLGIDAHTDTFFGHKVLRTTPTVRLVRS